ncbi:hypothetical protein LPJ73_005652, partial [Coemansia sp. RSA 2703]
VEVPLTTAVGLPGEGANTGAADDSFSECSGSVDSTADTRRSIQISTSASDISQHDAIIWRYWRSRSDTSARQRRAATRSRNSASLRAYTWLITRRRSIAARIFAGSSSILSSDKSAVGGMPSTIDGRPASSSPSSMFAGLVDGDDSSESSRCSRSWRGFESEGSALIASRTAHVSRASVSSRYPTRDFISVSCVVFVCNWWIVSRAFTSSMVVVRSCCLMPSNDSCLSRISSLNSDSRSDIIR